MEKCSICGEIPKTEFHVQQHFRVSAFTSTLSYLPVIEGKKEEQLPISLEKIQAKKIKIKKRKNIRNGKWRRKRGHSKYF